VFAPFWNGLNNRDKEPVTVEEGDQIIVLKAESLSLRSIARELGLHHTTISRELKRNAPPVRIGRYQYIYKERHDLVETLARHHRKRQKRGYSRKHRKSHIPNRISIEKRPKFIEKRIQVGHWERGTNENTNGLIRRFLPKKTDFSKVFMNQINQIEFLLNNRPSTQYDWLEGYLKDLPSESWTIFPVETGNLFYASKHGR
jgi:IS30 family transposase